MHTVAQQPTTPDARSVVINLFRHLSLCQLVQQPGKIDPGVNRQLEGSPKAGVYLHQIWGAVMGDLEFHHRHPVPSNRIQNSSGDFEQARIYLDAFTQDTDSARRRLFSQALVHEEDDGGRPVVKSKDSLCFAADVFLKQERVLAKTFVLGDN